MTYQYTKANNTCAGQEFKKGTPVLSEYSCGEVQVLQVAHRLQSLQS